MVTYSSTATVSKDRRFIARVVWLLAGLLIGLIVGIVRADRRLNSASKSLSQLLAVSEYENLALLQYKHADTSRARRAMLDAVTFMDRVEASHFVADERALEFDRSLMYTRLALLDEKSDDEEAYRKHIAMAAQCAEEIAGTTISEARLRETAAQFDSDLP